MNAVQTPPPLDVSPPPKKKKYGCLKILLIVLGVLALLIFVLSKLGERSVDEMAEAAEPFFLATQKGDFAGAYEMTTKDFKDGFSLEEFSQFAKENGLADYAAGEWEYGPYEDDGDAAIEGHIMTAGGEKFPLRIAFVTTGDRKMISWISRAYVEKPVETETAGSTVATPVGSGSGEKKVLFSFTTAKLKNIRFNTNPDEDAGIREEFPDSADAILFRAYRRRTRFVT